MLLFFTKANFGLHHGRMLRPVSGSYHVATGGILLDCNGLLIKFPRDANCHSIQMNITLAYVMCHMKAYVILIVKPLKIIWKLGELVINQKYIFSMLYFLLQAICKHLKHRIAIHLPEDFK